MKNHIKLTSLRNLEKMRKKQFNKSEKAKLFKEKKNKKNSNIVPININVSGNPNINEKKLQKIYENSYSSNLGNGN